MILTKDMHLRWDTREASLTRTWITSCVRDNVEKLKLANPDDVLIKVKVAGINPIDYVVISGSIPTVKPMLHIQAAEVSGTLEESGNDVNGLKRVTGLSYIAKSSIAHATCAGAVLICFAETAA